MQKINVNGHVYKVKKLLGKGKSGYSFLVTYNHKLFVLKKFHDEPCSYYEFTNKFQSEISSYNTLKKLKIRTSKIIKTDESNDIIIKQYIDGPLISDLVLANKMKRTYINQIKKLNQLQKNQPKRKQTSCRVLT